MHNIPIANKNAEGIYKGLYYKLKTFCTTITTLFEYLHNLM